MTDRELLELAAKAAGYVVRWYDDTLTHGPTFGIEVEPGNPCGFEPWNPLTDDGDALRLAVKLEMQLRLRHRENEVSVYGAPDGRVDEGACSDPCAATRRAIVRAAAEIGRVMP